jgi:hypothetical protein
MESSVTATESFTVSVMIDNADDLGGFQFCLFYITATITVDNVTVGDFVGSTGRSLWPIGPDIDNEAGKVTLAVASFGSAPGPDGTGELASISLTAQSEGESPLDLQAVMAMDTNGKPQTTTVEDGVVRVRFAVYLPLILKD